MSRKIEGEGTYGCVHSPPIKCKVKPKQHIIYKDYVSKLMKTNDARVELSEFIILRDMDPNNDFHLGTPISCEPNLTGIGVTKDIAKCKSIKIKDVYANPNNYSILLMKNGGTNLKIFCDDHLRKKIANYKNTSDLFWFNVHNLLKGLLTLKTYGFVHYDIKPQNILINLGSLELKYIDFGTMRRKHDVLTSSKNGTNALGIFHWSYPFDCGFMNNAFYKAYNEKSEEQRTIYKNIIAQRIILNKNAHPNVNIPIYNQKSFDILFTYLNPDNVIPTSSTRYAYLTSFFDGFNEMIGNNSYDTVLNHMVDSIDVFSIGFTLQYMANNFYNFGGLSLEDFTTLSNFFHKMWDFNPTTRSIDMNKLLNEYETILLELGILTRMDRRFENHKIYKAFPIPAVIMKEAKKDERSAPERLSHALETEANKDPTIKCLKGEELNPKTNKCVKQCKDGYARNEKFQCKKVSEKSKMTKETKSAKICPGDQELNPKTNRCVKKCGNGYVRNEQFQCKKIDVKSKMTGTTKTKSAKICPGDQELNPKTNRCIKKCGDGYVRNEQFQCKKTLKQKAIKETQIKATPENITNVNAKTKRCMKKCMQEPQSSSLKSRKGLSTLTSLSKKN
jgi:serine/threonine protein kinase